VLRTLRKLQTLKQIWNEYNELVFGGKLEYVPIMLTRAKKYYGYYGVTDSSQKASMYISGHWNKPIEELRATLLHEMVHQFLHQSGEPDWHGHAEPFLREQARIRDLTGLEI